MWFQGNHYVSTDKAQEHLTKKMQKIIMLQAVVQALSMFSHISFFSFCGAMESDDNAFC